MRFVLFFSLSVMFWACDDEVEVAKLQDICCECECYYAPDLGVPPHLQKGSGEYADCDVCCDEVCATAYGGDSGTRLRGSQLEPAECESE